MAGVRRKSPSQIADRKGAVRRFTRRRRPRDGIADGIGVLGHRTERHGHLSDRSGGPVRQTWDTSGTWRKRSTSRSDRCSCRTSTRATASPGAFGIGLSLNEDTSISLGYQHDYVLGTETVVDGTASESESAQVGSLLFGVSHTLTDNVGLNLNFAIGGNDRRAGCPLDPAHPRDVLGVDRKPRSREGYGPASRRLAKTVISGRRRKAEKGACDERPKSQRIQQRSLPYTLSQTRYTKGAYAPRNASSVNLAIPPPRTAPTAPKNRKNGGFPGFFDSRMNALSRKHRRAVYRKRNRFADPAPENPAQNEFFLFIIN